jgi:hypothetical protein
MQKRERTAVVVRWFGLNTCRVNEPTRQIALPANAAMPHISHTVEDQKTAARND